MSQPYRREIDGLRGLAVLMVLVYHAWPGLLPGGFTGVDIFFVISGYVVTRSLRYAEGTDQGLLPFYLRRVRRLFPALLFTLWGTLALGRFGLNWEQFDQLRSMDLAGALFVPNLWALNFQGYFDQGAHLGPLSHLWSLGVEEQFYLTWPLIHLALRRRYGSLHAVLLVLAGLSLIHCLSGQSEPAFYLPTSRAWQLLGGAWLALMEPTSVWPPVEGKGYFGWLGLLLIAVAGYLASGDGYPGLWALAPVVGSLGLIYGSPRSPRLRKLLGAWPLYVCGLLSYPLYLFHWPALTFVPRFVPPWVPAAACAPLALLLSFGLAGAFHLAVERPLRRSGPLGAAVLVGLLALTAVGLLAWDGSADRDQAARQRREELVRRYGMPDSEWRRGDCFLFNQAPSDFKAACLDREPKAGPLVALVGDSTAASLYPGLKLQAAQHGFRLAQWTVATCPPLLFRGSKDIPHCDEAREWIRQRLQEEKPQLILLSAHWEEHLRKGDKDILAELQDFLRSVHQWGRTKVVVIGQLPAFSLPQSIAGRQDFNAGKARTWRGLDRHCFDSQALVAQAMQGLDATLINPLAVLCGPDGCRISASDSEFIPMASDHVHLTLEGSKRLVAEIPWAWEAWLPQLARPGKALAQAGKR